MDERVAKKFRIALDSFGCFIENNVDAFPCKGGTDCIETCEFWKGEKCLMRELTMAAKSVESAIRVDSRYAIVIVTGKQIGRAHV